MAKVLVTGANGYIAGHVIQQLLEEGHVVRGTVRNVLDTEQVKHLYELCPLAEQNLEIVEAELLKADTWIPAAEGMKYVIHVASPFPDEAPLDAEGEALVKTAVQGTVNVLTACANAPSVDRLVLTGSANAVHWGTETTNKTYDEINWSEVSKLDYYCKSKTLAEKAAWDFIDNLPGDRKLELAVINPSTTLGPPLAARECTSTKLVKKFLDHLIPAVPKMNLPIVDVRDVARAHLVAMTSPQAAGQRHIIHAENMWLSEMAQLLKCIFHSQGYNIPTMVVPNMILRTAGLVDGSVRAILPYLGVIHKYSNRRMLDVLAVEPRNIRTTVIDMAHALIATGFVHKTDKYTGPRGQEEIDKYMTLKLK